MIHAGNSPEIFNLQKQVAQSFTGFKYYKDKYQEYEQNFSPHITIARELSQSQYEKSLQDLGENIICEAKITEVILTVVENYGAAEANLPENQTVYELKSK